MPFRTATVSSPGGRPGNEDSRGYLELGSAACWVVADGLGGHAGGAIASRLAVDAALASFRANPEVTADALRAHIRQAEALVRQHQADPAMAQMRTTVVVLLANVREAFLGHVGDSRGYCFQAGRVLCQTRDDSVPGALAASGSIRACEIRDHEDRSRLLRSLGNANLGPIPVSSFSLCRGDAFLLCSDGFWEHVTETEMEIDWTKSPTPSDWLGFLVARLLARAPSDHDNYTAIAISFDSPTAPVPSPPEFRRAAAPLRPPTSRPLAGLVVLLLLTLAGTGAVLRWPQSALQFFRAARQRVVHLVPNGKDAAKTVPAPPKPISGTSKSGEAGK
jgi:serine/threonine protein phosphatase PrpC